MVCKKYSAEFKRNKVEEYLEETKEKKITKAEFALRNNISDSTFNDWVLKYQRDKQGFCNITNEIVKLNEIETIKATDYLVRTISEDVFPNSVLTPSFAASIICFKYQLSIPLYRYSEMLKGFGINISESNLCNYVKRASEKLDRLYEELKKELLNNVVIHVDETTLVVLDEKEKCYMFVYRSGHWTDKQVCLYEFNESRKTDKTAKLLNEYKGYDFLEEKGIKIQRC